MRGGESYSRFFLIFWRDSDILRRGFQLRYGRHVHIIYPQAEEIRLSGSRADSGNFFRWIARPLNERLLAAATRLPETGTPAWR
jgi:hypothetical protein